jgi:ribosomal protein S18 acetylase RimI-like enzyme
MKQCGFTKAIDTLSYMAWHGHPFPEKYNRLVKRIEANPKINIRPFNEKKAKEDILSISSIYNNSFKNTWRFVPMTEAEEVMLGESLLRIADSNLIWIASYKEQPVGAILGFPDINEILKKLNGHLFPRGIFELLFRQNKIKGMRIAALMVLPEFRTLAIETILIHKVHNRVHNRPYQRSEFSVIMENNHRMRNLLEAFGFSLCRRYRLYTQKVENLL